MSDKVNVVKATLSTGKVVLLRELKIKHQEMAAIAAGPRSGGNPNVLAVLIQRELLKQLICSIDNQPVKPIQLEDLDNVFTFREYSELGQILAQLMDGGDSVGKFQIELVSSGGI